MPYVHMVKYVKETYHGERDGDLPIICIGLTSGLGRLFFGYIADFKWVNRIVLQQLAFAIMGMLIIAIPLIESYPVLIVISLGMGIVDGCFIALLGPVAYGKEIFFTIFDDADSFSVHFIEKMGLFALFIEIV